MVKVLWSFLGFVLLRSVASQSWLSQPPFVLLEVLQYVFCACVIVGRMYMFDHFRTVPSIQSGESENVQALFHGWNILGVSFSVHSSLKGLGDVCLARCAQKPIY